MVNARSNINQNKKLKNIRHPFVSGQFYDSDPTLLKKQIKDIILSVSEKPSETLVRAMILPHAGYCFSAETAIKTLLKTDVNKYQKVFILAPSHRYSFNGIAVSDYDAYTTPFGLCKVDKDISLELLKTESPYIHHSNDAHLNEHSLEVELPILQYFNSDIEIIPLITSHIDKNNIDDLSNILKQFWKEDILWIISSDFTHFGSSFGYMPFENNIKENIKKLDMEAINHILNIDVKNFTSYLEKTQATICGRNAISLLLKIIANSANNISGTLIDYTTSMNITNDDDNSVSYAGIIFSS